MKTYGLLGALLAAFAWSCGAGGEQTAEKNPSGIPGCVILAYSETDTDTLRVAPNDSIVVLDWLRMVCDSTSLPLGTKSYPFGDLVIQIGDRKNGEGGYWLYKVNSQPVPKAASSHRVAPTDTVLFFYQ